MKKITAKIIYMMMYVLLLVAVWIVFFLFAIADGHTLYSAAIEALTLRIPSSILLTILWLIMSLGDWIIDNK